MKTCCACRQVLPIEAFYPNQRMCRACSKAHARAWKKRNQERARNNLRAWRRANPDNVRGHIKRWEGNRPGYKRAKEHLRRQSGRRRVPWYRHAEVAVYYRLAKALRALGHDVHVGHWVPLRGKNVCGLHVHCNLCLELAHDNMSKGARVVPQAVPPAVSRARSVRVPLVQD